MYALAAQYLGMRFVYLEAGSGVTSHVSANIVKNVRNIFSGCLVVGGGIKDVTSSLKIARAGADILVFGTLLERRKFDPILKEIVNKVTTVHKS
jgi:phosphoglycerol geranylgeranyltransferase